MRNSVVMLRTARGRLGSEATFTSAVTPRLAPRAADPEPTLPLPRVMVPWRARATLAPAVLHTVARRVIRARVVGLFALAVAIACDHSSSAGPAPATGSSSKGKVMTGFTAASAAFRDHAIKALGTKDISLAPNGEAKMPHTYGGAWAFNAAPSNQPDRAVRGWATGNGTVITTQQNFGLLLAEAGLWSTPRGDLSKLPAAIAWSLGNAYTAPGGPDVKLGADGSGTITCYLLYQEGGGGGYVSPQVPVEVVIAVSKDHTATVKITKQS